jgi:hypothetical protein
LPSYASLEVTSSSNPALLKVGRKENLAAFCPSPIEERARWLRAATRAGRTLLAPVNQSEFELTGLTVIGDCIHATYESLDQPTTIEISEAMQVGECGQLGEARPFAHPRIGAIRGEAYYHCQRNRSDNDCFLRWLWHHPSNYPPLTHGLEITLEAKGFVTESTFLDFARSMWPVKSTAPLIGDTG